MLIHFYLVYVRHFLNTILFFGPFWCPFLLRALGSRLVRLMVALALGIYMPSLEKLKKSNFLNCILYNQSFHSFSKIFAEAAHSLQSNEMQSNKFMQPAQSRQQTKLSI